MCNTYVLTISLDDNVMETCKDRYIPDVCVILHSFCIFIEFHHMSMNIFWIIYRMYNNNYSACYA